MINKASIDLLKAALAALNYIRNSALKGSGAPYRDTYQLAAAISKHLEKIGSKSK